MFGPEHVQHQSYHSHSDDFPIIAHSRDICYQQLNFFVDFCTYVGVPIAPEKTCGPAQLCHLQESNTVMLEARLPADRILKCKDLVSDFLMRKKVTLHDVQSLVGLLNFACSVIHLGWARPGLSAQHPH